MTPRVSWLGDFTVPPADFLEREQLKPVLLPSPRPARGFSRAWGVHSGPAPERSHQSPVCKGLHRLGARHWSNWFPVGDVTSIRHTGAVGLAHVLLNQHEAPRAHGGEASARVTRSAGAAQPRAGRGPSALLRNANPLRGQVRSARPRPPHPAATATAATCPSPLVPSPACPGPVQVSPGRTHTNGATGHLPRSDHGSISARLRPGTATDHPGLLCPPVPPGPAGTPCAVEGTGGCWQLPEPRGTRVPPKGANSSAGGSNSSFPFRPRGTWAGESPGPRGRCRVGASRRAMWSCGEGESGEASWSWSGAAEDRGHRPQPRV